MSAARSRRRPRWPACSSAGAIAAAAELAGVLEVGEVGDQRGTIAACEPEWAAGPRLRDALALMRPREVAGKCNQCGLAPKGG
jgi:hypothetical protein